jgi:hypothetical protein
MGKGDRCRGINTHEMTDRALLAASLSPSAVSPRNQALSDTLESDDMPEISRFFGIVIAMYHREHEPAHFHVRYGSLKGTVRISDGFVDGKFPPRVKAMVLEWWDLHREELAANWQLAREKKELKPISPLE